MTAGKLDTLRTPGWDEGLPRQTLLVIDDDVGPRESLRIIFRDTYRVLFATHGKEALQIASGERVDVAVLDIRMPGMSGIEVLKGLKEIDPAIEVIMLTGFQTLESARNALRLDAFDYLSKPFDLETIRSTVGNAMRRRSQTDAMVARELELDRLRDEAQQHQLRERIARSTGEIYASVIHDVNGPLTVISGYIDIINHTLRESETLSATQLAETKQYLTHITRQVDIAIRIVHRYLNFFRGRNSPESSVGVNQVLADLQDLLRVHPAARAHQFHVRQLPIDHLVRINGTDFLQILLNLSINAFQCQEAPHRVDVTCRVELKPVDTSHWQDGPHDRYLTGESFNNQPPLVVISVADTGPGIEPETLKRLFEAGFTTKEEGKGTGLGLAIVERFVYNACGALHIHSKPGEGSIFNLYLVGAPSPLP